MADFDVNKFFKDLLATPEKKLEGIQIKIRTCALIVVYILATTSITFHLQLLIN
jgi:hypothetical protein